MMIYAEEIKGKHRDQLSGQKYMFYEFLDMFIHQWETKEDYDLVMKEQEKEDWEAYKNNNQSVAPVTTGPLGAFAKLAGGGAGGLANL